MKSPTKTSLRIRWLVRSDMPAVLEIERLSFEFPWSEADFISCFKQRNVIGMVAEHEGEIAGFMVYQMHKSRLELLNFAVHPDYRRTGVGAEMVEKLTNKLTQQRRQSLGLLVRETNLAAQKFFASQGFIALRVVRGHYEDTTEDAYWMEFWL